ncbi:MAG: T9SS type A sorting domain-containing protein [Bacteroidia bacterium]
MKRIHIFSFALCLLMQFFQVSIAQQTRLFSKTFGGANYDVGSAILQTGDSGFIIAGQTMSYGDTLGDAYLVRINREGNEIWDKSYSQRLLGGANAIAPASDGGFLLAGHSETDSFDCQFYLIRVNSSGDTIWTRMFGGVYDDAASAVIQTNDGNFVLAGFADENSPSGSDAYIVKIDISGNILWAKKYGSTANEYANSIRQTADGGYIFAGKKENPTAGYDVYLVKLDSSGNKQWEKTYGGNKDDLAYCVRNCKDGGYVISGLTYSFGNGSADIYLIRINATGDLLWTKTFGGNLFDQSYDILQVEDSGFMVAGFTRSFGDTMNDIYIISTDKNGMMNWSKTMGGKGDDVALSIIESFDKTYVIAGRTSGFGAGNADMFVFQMDDKGTSSTGVGEIIRNPGMSTVFPNPFSENATLTYANSKNKNTTLFIYDLNGKLITELKDTGIGSFHIEKNYLSNGIYFYRLLDADENTLIGKGKFVVE